MRLYSVTCFVFVGFMSETVAYSNCHPGVYGTKIRKRVNEIAERVRKLIKTNCMVIRIKKL